MNLTTASAVRRWFFVLQSMSADRSLQGRTYRRSERFLKRDFIIIYHHFIIIILSFSFAFFLSDVLQLTVDDHRNDFLVVAEQFSKRMPWIDVSVRQEDVRGLERFPFLNPPNETNTTSKNLEEQPWYHGLRPRRDILCLLQTPGDWLVRSTDSREIPEIVISIRVESKKEYQHLTLKFERNKWILAALRKKNPERFDTVVDLVEYYKVHELPGKAVMKKPIYRPKWLIKHDMVKFDMTKLMFEVFNNGDKPWPDDELKRIATHIRKGKMPEMPAVTPPPLKQVVVKIWVLNPEERPTMERICNDLKALSKGEFKIKDPSTLTVKGEVTKTKTETYAMELSDSARANREDGCRVIPSTG